MAVKIFLIRHGKTRLSEEGRYQGSLDLGLSADGKAALRPAAERPEHVYVSPALRAGETARILFPDARQIEIASLREMDFGVFEGRGWWEMEQDPAYRAWVDSGCRDRCPGGEDRTAFSERVCEAFRQILETEQLNREAEVFVVAHGGTQMAVLERWGSPAREYYRWQSRCGCGWLLDWDGKEERLRVQEELCFLK